MANLLDGIYSRTIPGLIKAMDMSFRRNEAIVSNIANAETPGYRAVDMDFNKELEQAFGEDTSQLLKTNSKHMDTAAAGGSAHMIADVSGATKPDGNNVDIDLQMGRLAYNAGRYSIAANLMRKKLGFVKEAIRASLR